ncbi:hypothetical protein NA56DRAFT_662630 [Hyaloscypha hepaticicola]|uniref:Uncharacterized protein n=1 Tax=Hyaloscypha hepaticicola TaxID=2082293 RepID=A0A2J6PSN1_9HELO|nr:hypothetical protein NA56DRAFT_662630 [Hyaloscypha hepaticicola]
MVRSMPYEYKYEIQTEWGVVERLFPVKELKTVADQIEVRRPKKKLSLKKVAEYASSADRVIISSEHDCGFLASLALRTGLVLKDNPAKKRGTKRLRANTTGKVVEK